MYRLINIQQKLKAPKNQRNNFGGYNFRSAEDILEAVKPLLAETKTLLLIKDEIIQIGDRYYVNAIATLYGDDGKEIASTNAFAREEENKKGMDASQLTGATSSYARKYALNGLFAIDDNKDADATNKHEKEKTKPKQVKKSAEDELFPEEKENPDVDIITGIAAINDISNLEVYYWQNIDKVKDDKTFNVAINKRKAVINDKSKQ